MPSWGRGWGSGALSGLGRGGCTLGGVLRGDHLDLGVWRGMEQHRNLAHNFLTILNKKNKIKKKENRLIRVTEKRMMMKRGWQDEKVRC